MNLRQWLLARPDGRRRIDIINHVLSSTRIELPSGRSPYLMVDSKEASIGELAALGTYLGDYTVFPGFSTDFCTIEWPWPKLNEHRTEDFWGSFIISILAAVIEVIATAGWSACPDDADRETDAGEVQDFLGALEVRLAAQTPSGWAPKNLRAPDDEQDDQDEAGAGDSD